MKIVVCGTGLMGSKLVSKLWAGGDDPLAASLEWGVDTISGEGPVEALEGAHEATAHLIVEAAMSPVTA